MANNTANTSKIGTKKTNTKKKDLNSILRIMDVATELRKQREIAEDELNIEDEKERIRQKIKKTAELTGENLTEEEVSAAIENFYNGLYRYTAPKKGISYYLAKLYISRGKIFKFLVFPLLLISTLFFGNDKFTEFQTNREQSYLAQQIQELPSEAEKLARAIKNLSNDPVSLKNVEMELNRIKTAKLLPSKLQGVNDIHSSISNLEQELAELRLEYDVLISNKKTGVDRYYSDEQGRRVSGYYIVVQARDKAGNPLTINVLNTETDKSSLVNTWAERVSKNIYDAVRRDKIDNGIIDNRVFAKKELGKKDLTMIYKNSFGESIKREAQITQW